MTPPTRTEPCPTCGTGHVDVFDVAAMKEERLRLGLTQADLADAAGWAPNQVAMLETGYRAMTADAAARYWRALPVAKRGKEVKNGD